MIKAVRYKSITEKDTILGRKIKAIEAHGQDELEKLDFTSKLEDDIKLITDIFISCNDLILRSFNIQALDKEAAIIYLNGMIDKNIVNQNVIGELINKSIVEKLKTEDIYNVLMKKLISISSCKWLNNGKDAVNCILNGDCVLIVDGLQKAICLSVEAFETKPISEANIESTIKGPQVAFAEKLDVSITQVRRRLKTSELKAEYFEVGSKSKTRIALTYIDRIVDKKVIRLVRQMLKKIEIDIVLDVGQLQPLLEESWISPFPQIELTQRPDSSVAALAEGRVVILMDGTSFVLIAPTTFTYLFTSPEDYYNRFYFATFIRILRYISFFTSLFGPAIYIAITTFHPEMLPASLLITIANSRADVPFPAMVEAFLMEIIFEVIREAGARQPKNIGQALNIVGALVIGQLSVQAGLVSPAMIIVVSITGLSSFLIPKINSSREISLMRFPMMLIGGIFGIFGLIMGFLALMIHALSLRSFGVPYMSPLAPIDFTALKDTILKLPENLLGKRPSFFQKNNINRRKDN